MNRRVRSITSLSFLPLAAIALASVACDVGDPPPVDEEDVGVAPAMLAATTPEGVISGTSTNLSSASARTTFAIPPSKVMVDIVGVAVDKTSHKVYYWYADGTRSVGDDTDADKYEAPTPFSLGATNFAAKDIVGVGIASSSHVRYFFRKSDDTLAVSEGTSHDVDYYGGAVPVTMPPARKASDVIGVDLAANDHVYTWYRDGRVSHGTLSNLAQYNANPANLPQFDMPEGSKPGHVRDMGIGAGDRVYTWMQDMEKGVAPPALADAVDPVIRQTMLDQRRTAESPPDPDDTHGAIAGMTVAVTKNGHLIMSRAYGYKNVATQESLMPTDRARIGSVGKLITTMAALRERERSPSFGLSHKVYGPSGFLTVPSWQEAMTKGQAVFQPLVGLAIDADDHVFAWYANRKRSVGWSGDLGNTVVDYVLPPGEEPEDLIGVAFNSAGKVYSWYRDGKRSIGTPNDLGAESTTTFSIPSGWDYDDIAGIAIRQSDDHVFAWSRTKRKFVEGTSTNLAGDVTSFVPDPNHSTFDIVEMDFASTGLVYAYYSDGMVSAGSPGHLGDAIAAYDTHLAPGASVSHDFHAEYNSITLAQLLSHSSGFAETSESGTKLMYGVTDEDMTYAELDQFMLQTRQLLFTPGTGQSYSNHGFGMVGYLVKLHSGVSYEQFAKSYILAPATISRIVRRDTDLDGHDAVPYGFDRDAGTYDSKPMVPDVNDLGLAAGGWVACAEDLGRLMLATDRLSGHPDVLTSSSLDLMETKQPGTSYALGWKIDTAKKKVAKDGAADGGRGYVARYLAGAKIGGVDVSGITVSIAINGEPDSTIFAGLTDAIAKAAATEDVDPDLDLF